MRHSSVVINVIILIGCKIFGANGCPSTSASTPSRAPTPSKGGVALTDTQKSEYWTMPHYMPISPAWNSSTCSLHSYTQLLTLLIFAHPISPFVQQSTPEQCHCAFSRHQQCVGWRRVQVSPTAVLVRTQRCSGPLASVWRSEPTSRSPRPSVCAGSTAVSNNGKHGKPLRLVRVHARMQFLSTSV